MQQLLPPQALQALALSKQISHNSPKLNTNSSHHDSHSTLKTSKSKKVTKLSEKQKREIWFDLYDKTKLSRFEIYELEQQLVQKGVKVKRINPKAISKG